MHIENASFMQALRAVDELKAMIPPQEFDSLVQSTLDVDRVRIEDVLGPLSKALGPETLKSLRHTLQEYRELKGMIKTAGGLAWSTSRILRMLQSMMAITPDRYFISVFYLLAVEIIARHNDNPLSFYISPAQLGLSPEFRDPSAARSHQVVSRSLRIFIASTITDLKEYRKAAAGHIRDLGHEPELVERFDGQSPREVAENCRAIMQTCQLCILLVGTRRGSGPFDGDVEMLSKQSFTMLEFRAAVETDTTVYCYMIKEVRNGTELSSTLPTAEDGDFLQRFQEEFSGHVTSCHPVWSQAQLRFLLGLDIASVSAREVAPPPAVRLASDNVDVLNIVFSPEIAAKLLEARTAWKSEQTRGPRELASLTDGYPSAALGTEFTRADEFNNQGWMLHEQARYEEAIECYRYALDACPSFPLVWNNLGLAYFRTGNFELAQSSYLEAIRNKPGFTKPWSNLAIAYWELRHDGAQAKQWLHRALSLDPTYPRAVDYLELIETNSRS